ncbi:TetR/AcrR family transcriptional regulator [bacterium]|nr:TetR/AcrR family transcriptional regulator [bacterium]
MTRETFPSNSQQTPTENSILEHGLDMLTRDGVRGFTVECLAQDLAMSKKTIYKFFPTKEILLQNIFKYITTVLINHFERILKKDINPLDKFYTALDEVIKILNRVSISRISELKARYPKIWRDIEAFRLARREDFLSIFVDGQKQGFIRRDIDIELTATLFMNIVNSVFQPEFFLANQVGPRDVMFTFREIFLRGIITDKGLKHIEDNL